MRRRLRPWLCLLLLSACERPVTPRPVGTASAAPAAGSAQTSPAEPATPPEAPAAQAPLAAAPGGAGELWAAPPPASAGERPVGDVAGRPSRRQPTGRPVPRRAEPDTGLGGECRSDDDCVAVPVGCCGCRNGGAQRAVSKSAAEAAPQCRDVMCPMVISRHPSCRKVARCIDGACALASPPAEKQGQAPDYER